MRDTTSIIVLLRNGGAYLDSLVPAVASQRHDREKQLVVVDSGSTDGSVEQLVSLCERHGLRLDLSIIEPREFGHGRTRNYAVEKAAGEVLAVLSQDALPLSETWLDDITAPLSQDNVAGVFGRQVPRPGTRLCEALFYDLTYPGETRRMDGREQPSFSNLNLFFSNVNGAFRKSLSSTYPFRDDLVMSEDQFWGRAVLREGYSIVYEPRAAVLHSHNYSLRQLFKRYFQSGYSMRQMGLSDEITRGGIRTVTSLLSRVLHEKPSYLPYAAAYQSVQGFGFLCGRHDLLPGGLRDSLLDR